MKGILKNPSKQSTLNRRGYAVSTTAPLTSSRTSKKYNLSTDVDKYEKQRMSSDINTATGYDHGELLRLLAEVHTRDGNKTAATAAKNALNNINDVEKLSNGVVEKPDEDRLNSLQKEFSKQRIVYELSMDNLQTEVERTRADYAALRSKSVSSDDVISKLNAEIVELKESQARLIHEKNMAEQSLRSTQLEKQSSLQGLMSSFAHLETLVAERAVAVRTHLQRMRTIHAEIHSVIIASQSTVPKPIEEQTKIEASNVKTYTYKRTIEDLLDTMDATMGALAWCCTIYTDDNNVESTDGIRRWPPDYVISDVSTNNESESSTVDKMLRTLQAENNHLRAELQLALVPKKIQMTSNKIDDDVSEIRAAASAKLHEKLEEKLKENRNLLHELDRIMLDKIELSEKLDLSIAECTGLKKMQNVAAMNEQHAAAENYTMKQELTVSRNTVTKLEAEVTVLARRAAEAEEERLTTDFKASKVVQEVQDLLLEAEERNKETLSIRSELGRERAHNTAFSEQLFGAQEDNRELGLRLGHALREHGRLEEEVIRLRRLLECKSGEARIASQKLNDVSRSHLLHAHVPYDRPESSQSPMRQSLANLRQEVQRSPPSNSCKVSELNNSRTFDFKGNLDHSPRTDMPTTNPQLLRLDAEIVQLQQSLDAMCGVNTLR